MASSKSSMPLFPRHVRHHTWPYCGPAPRSHDREDRRLRHAPRRRSSLRDYFLSLEDSTVNPLYRDIFYEDDAASAGIVRSKSARSRRLWSSPEDDEQIVSTVSKADGTPKAVLRRVVLPRLDKARHMFPKHSISTRGSDAVVMAYMEVPAPSKTPTKPRDMRATQSSTSLKPTPERHHRRCHSEQPRAWREPSASLWTLLEE